jgi:hypothetical protein
MATQSTTDPSRRKKLLDEFSKLSFVALEVVGVGNLAAYWCAVFAGLAPEPDVAVTGIVELIAPYIGYCALQLGLKTSLNKNKLKIGASGSVVGIDAEDADEEPINE